MRETIRKIIIHGVTAIAVFIAALIFFNVHISSEKGNPMAELANSSYPVMEIEDSICDYNMMSAYRGDIDLSLVRNQITVVDNSKTLSLKLHNYGYDITAIQYVLYEKNPKEPLEEGTLNQLKDDEAENVRTGTLTFQSDLKQGKNYYLRMAVRLDHSTKAYFYTKVQNGAGYHLEEYFTFVNTFHNNLFDKTVMEENAAYLETSADTGNNSLENVSIHSTSNELSFGNMEVKQETVPKVKIKELNETYAVVEMTTILSSKIREGVVQYYDVHETYKMRCAAERMYLLDYQRTMDAYYNENVIDSANNYISLGIQNENNVDYVYADEGYKVCFAVEGQLWYYDYNSSDVSKIYSFASENLADLRNDQEEHGIKILNMDEDGNIRYLIYGYINRGRHEGANGIGIMRYDAETNCNEELAFLSTAVPYDSMKEDVEKLAYLNADGIFYCILDGDLHSVNLEKKEDTILESGMVNESITASKDQSIIAIEKKQDLSKNTEIEMIDLESGKKQIFSCGKRERIRSVGFLSDDFIYGVALTKEVSKEASGAITFPMTQLHIMNMEGEEVKNYTKKNRYIMDTKISGSVLEMKFGRKNGAKFTETSDIDYIRYKEEAGSDAVSLVYQYSEPYWNQLYIRFPEYVYIQVEPDLVLTKILVNEDDVSLTLGKSGNKVKQYYVYADGKQQAVCTNLPEAVNGAFEERGNVIDNSEKILWQCVFEEYAQVVGMEQVTKVSSDARSLAGCLSMIASVNGKKLSVEEIDTGSDSIANLLEKSSGCETLNLSGCTTDEILYYVSQGSPVLAKYNSNRYVIVMSYNSTKIRYLDPVTGLSTAADRTQVTAALERAGNVFYSYLADE